ncbi:hypothetical protein PV08_05588 [Exophiala spinifera]|uniref:Uncharacterized protein n=1 Tax=Exophiala spinifera TaxID=91928 RepID=A0A0D2BAF5_9EURO|nr:uncharacterized protein PV08_05588 [Exophiala spinifera]KIW15540.1 hypothetical protein PV08_05588 [Exophiala spinifera]
MAQNHRGRSLLHRPLSDPGTFEGTIIHFGVDIYPRNIHWVISPRSDIDSMAHIRSFRGLPSSLIALGVVRYLLLSQALWYFIGSAVVLGAALGLFLHFAMRAVVLMFKLDKKPKVDPAPPTGHDAISYRKAREEKKRKQLEEQQRLAVQAKLIASQPLLQDAVREARKMPLSSTPIGPLSPNISVSNRHGLLQQTILEHSDEDDDSSVF